MAEAVGSNPTESIYKHTGGFMKKFKGYITLEVEVDATTLEGAKQKLDNSIDFSELARREISVVGYYENVGVVTENSSTGVIKG